MKRKFAAVLAGGAVLGTLAFASFAQDAVVVDRTVSPGTTTIVEPATPGARVVVVEPVDNLAALTSPAPYESQLHYGFAAARQPGSVPSPYGSPLPGSGHIGDEWYYKQFGGVSPP